ncbi:NUDIX hydrolase [Actinomadura hibisca]|uniref:NUDIX hydrolase n=1 Tax=Actinomadura hibisca TaxID=68565 RepID=UPI00082CE093|nr:NUDIX domain-containing protein [Actinomadura hibisca]
MAETEQDGGSRETVHAAGAVLWRDGGGGPEIAVVHRPRHDDWSLPKGKVDPGEHVLRTAVREVAEETGIVALLGRRLPTVRYVMPDQRLKHVDYWAARAEATAAPFTPNDEVDRLDWLPVDAAAERLSYPHDVDLLRVFAAGPARTRPLVILRHGSAGEKRAWTEPDELRPLDAQGRAEAARLADLLAVFGQVSAVSSATARCLETVLPYARRARVEVATEAAFTVGGGGAAVERLLGLIEAGGPALVCTHGEIVTELVTGMCRTFGEKVPDEPQLPKGGFWVAQLAGDGSVASLERHHP